MKNLTSIGLVTMLAASLSGCAQNRMMMRQGSMQDGASMKSGMDVTMMDTNNDAMISKEKFMKHHEAMYDKMKKGSNGMVSIKNMQMMMNDMMMEK